MKKLLEIRKFNYSEYLNMVSYVNNLYYFNEYTHFYNITKVYLSNIASENFENNSYSDTDIYNIIIMSSIIGGKNLHTYFLFRSNLWLIIIIIIIMLRMDCVIWTRILLNINIAHILKRNLE